MALCSFRSSREGDRKGHEAAPSSTSGLLFANWREASFSRNALEEAIHPPLDRHTTIPKDAFIQIDFLEHEVAPKPLYL